MSEKLLLSYLICFFEIWGCLIFIFLFFLLFLCFCVCLFVFFVFLFFFFVCVNPCPILTIGHLIGIGWKLVNWFYLCRQDSESAVTFSAFMIGCCIMVLDFLSIGCFCVLGSSLFSGHQAGDSLEVDFSACSRWSRKRQDIRTLKGLE